MTWTLAKLAAAGVLTAIPIAAVGIPAYASEISGGRTDRAAGSAAGRPADGAAGTARVTR